MSTLHYEVNIKKKVIKDLNKIPFKIQKKFNALVRELMEKGPVLPKWPNYGKLENSKFHCHLSYHWHVGNINKKP